jgi:hypothetical protein
MLIHWRLSNKTASIIMDNLNSSNTNWGGSQQQGGFHDKQHTQGQQQQGFKQWIEGITNGNGKGDLL